MNKKHRNEAITDAAIAAYFTTKDVANPYYKSSPLGFAWSIGRRLSDAGMLVPSEVSMSKNRIRVRNMLFVSENKIVRNWPNW